MQLRSEYYILFTWSDRLTGRDLCVHHFRLPDLHYSCVPYSPVYAAALLCLLQSSVLSAAGPFLVYIYTSIPQTEHCFASKNLFLHMCDVYLHVLQLMALSPLTTPMGRHLRHLLA